GAEVPTLPAALLPEDLRELTFAAWVEPKGFKGTNVVVRKEDTGEAWKSSMKHISTRLSFAFQGDGRFLSFGVNCGGNYAECNALLDPAELLDGKRHFVAATFGAKDLTMRVFLDGREIGAFKRQVPLLTIHDFAPLNLWRDTVAHGNFKSLEEAARSRGAPFAIGATTSKTDVFNGAISEFRFYSRALSGDELRALHKAGTGNENSTAGGVAGDANDAAKLARKLYTKRASFLETLAATAENFHKETAAGGVIGNAAAIALHRLVRDDFPNETNDYIRKWSGSPVARFSLSSKQLRERLALLEKHNLRPFEYLPLTAQQWNVLSPAERAKWERAKAIKEKLADADAPLPAADFFFLETLVNERPDKRSNEAVAGYVKPETPETRDRSASEADALLEHDWLFQCDNKPTAAAALAEIGYARKLAAQLNAGNATTGGTISPAAKEKLAAALAKLDALETQAKSGEQEKKDIYLAVRRVKREIFFLNPAIDFDSVVYTDSPWPSGREAEHETRHRLGYQAVPGGRLLVQRGLSPAGNLRQLAPVAPLHGSFWRPDLSYDATRVVFSFKPHNEKTFHLYEVPVAGGEPRQLTGGMFDDLDPVYLPDGKNIVFTTTRGHIYVRCMPPTNAMVVAKMPLDSKPGDKSLYIISRNGEPEYTPSVLDDGRIIYTRWEYTDKPLWRAQSLWTMKQNGALVETFWGNQSVWPDLLKDARQIPGSQRVMFTGSAHHNWFAGSVGIIDPRKGLNFPLGLTKVTQDVAWPECGNGPVDPKENDTYHKSGKYTAYYSPYPLSEKLFLVSANRAGAYLVRRPDGTTRPSTERFPRKFVLLLMDTDGNRELVAEGAHHIFDAQPVRKRPVPQVAADTLEWPEWETRSTPAPGQMYSNNVYEGVAPELRGKAKFLRIWSIDHKTYTYWAKRNYVSSGPEISANQSEGIKKIIGTVPIEDDGSVNFNAPAGIALHFQLLDENKRALQTMKSFTGVQPGEARGCFGCHEKHMNSADSAIGKASRRRPSNITPVPWEDITVGFERYVQPALDEYCGGCHGEDSSNKKARAAFKSEARPGFLHFKEPYMTLLGAPTWGAPYKKRSDMGPAFGYADTILVEAYSTVDPAAYTTVPPMTRLSYKSRLVKRFAGEKTTAGDKHPLIKTDKESLERVILWVDAMGPYMGAEEIWKLEDPLFQGVDWLSQRPRIHTAPVVPRPGPFDNFHPETDPAYAAPPSVKTRNALPNGVKR
ncbi:MAG: hypothetical protein LBR07_06145, partial [Puniceicoccales bacterium]|nr:hypothetical protein [Puniceicoccales bacterium]